MRQAGHKPKTLTDAEQQKLLRESSRNENDLRDHILFSLAIGTGLRVSEICGLRVGDIRGDGGSIRGVVSLRPAITKGKRGGDIVIPDKLRRKLAAWVRQLKAQEKDTSPKAPLFPSRGGGRGGKKAGGHLTRFAVHRIFQGWQERLGFDRHCTFHQTRHSFCTNLYNETKDIRLVQMAARHANLNTTAIYAVPTLQDWVNAAQEIRC